MTEVEMPIFMVLPRADTLQAAPVAAHSKQAPECQQIEPPPPAGPRISEHGSSNSTRCYRQNATSLNRSPSRIVCCRLRSDAIWCFPKLRRRLQQLPPP